STAVIIAITGVGVMARHLTRRGRAPDLWALIAQLFAATCVLTMLLLPQDALLGIVPTSTTMSAAGPLIAEGLLQVQTSAAPLADTLGLRTVIAGGFALAVILLDHLVAQRLVLLAVLLVASVGALPMIVTFGDA